MPTYTDWPSHTDVTAHFSRLGITLSTDFTTDYITSKIEGAYEKLEMDTRRTFKPVDEVRSFDGSGNGMMLVNEYVSVTSITLIGVYGYTGSHTLTNFREISRNKQPKSRIAIYRGIVPIAIPGYFHEFPRGRDNVEISARWGYASTIPDPVWLAVRDKAAADILRENIYDPNGWLVQYKEADVMETTSYPKPAEMLQWDKEYAWVVKRYRRGTNFNEKKKRRQMM